MKDKHASGIKTGEAKGQRGEDEDVKGLQNLKCHPGQSFCGEGASIPMMAHLLQSFSIGVPEPTASAKTRPEILAR